MNSFQMEVFSKEFENLEDVADLQYIPEEHREGFKVFMRLMKARTLEEIKEISYETVVGFLEKISVFAPYLEQKEFSMEDMQNGFLAVSSVSIRRVL